MFECVLLSGLLILMGSLTAGLVVCISWGLEELTDGRISIKKWINKKLDERAAKKWR
jgi:hypothetical protein